MNTPAPRAYIRHPSKVDIQVTPLSTREQLNLEINNISMGGLSFDSNVSFYKDTVVKLKIPSIKPVFKVNAIIRWCREQASEQESAYELGVEFLDTDDAFKVRMIEQACHISEYRKEKQAKIGKRISWNQASNEWIEQNGGSFPR
jgi:PilZ domain